MGVIGFELVTNHFCLVSCNYLSTLGTWFAFATLSFLCLGRLVSLPPCVYSPLHIMGLAYVTSLLVW